MGLPLAAWPIMTPSQPVASSKAFAFLGLSTSPFPMTGMETASFTCRIMSQSAFAGIELLPGAAVDRHRGRAAGLGDLRDLHRDAWSLKLLPEFYRQGAFG